MGIKKVLLYPIAWLCDVFCYFSHLEDYRYSDKYEYYKRPKWISKILEG